MIKNMDCLIARQPYASLIAFGFKRWEFRSYDTKRGGDMQPETMPVILLTVVDAKNPHAFYEELLQRIEDATQYELDQSRVTAAAIEWAIVLESAGAIASIVTLIWEVLKERRKTEGRRIRVYLHVGGKPVWIESEDEKAIIKIAKDLTEHSLSKQAKKEFGRWHKEVTMSPWIKKGTRRK